MTTDASPPPGSPRRPNLVFFVPDQWRGDVLGHLGNPAASTPVLDRMVGEDAVSFSHAFCQNPVCTPSRCSFLSGWYPHVAGHRTMFHMLHPERGEPCLLKTLQESGYDVWWGGKNDFLPGTMDPVREGICSTRYQAATDPGTTYRDLHVLEDWKLPTGTPGYYAMFAGRLGKPGDPYLDPDWQTVHAAIRHVEQRDRERPFCLFIALQYPHPPYGVEEPYFSRIARDRLPERPGEERDGPAPVMFDALRERQNLSHFSENDWRELRATYYGMCARVDDQLGLLLDALRRTGDYEETGVFFFSDHGDFTGDYGLVEKAQNVFPDCLTRVPLVFKPPTSRRARPRVCDELVELIDIAATVFDLCGIEPGHDHFGRSLLPLLEQNPDVPHRDAVFCEGGRRVGESHCMEGRETDPASLYWPRSTLQQDDTLPYHGKAIMCRTREFKLISRLYEEDEFYDLRTDPGDQQNRINDPACQHIVSQLRTRTLQWLMETSDTVPHHLDRR